MKLSFVLLLSCPGGGGWGEPTALLLGDRKLEQPVFAKFHNGNLALPLASQEVTPERDQGGL